MSTLSSSVEDYLKAMYEIQQETGQDRVSTSALADKLQVSRASVTGMLKKLAAMDPSPVEYRPYRGVSLSPAGRKLALQIIRHHRLIEAYLAEALGYSWDEVHPEADLLEHVISEDLEDRIAGFLGHPEVDPHGHPIPDRQGRVRAQKELTLTDLEEGQTATLCRVSDRDPEMLRYLASLELKLNTKVVVVQRSPFEGPIHVRRVGEEAVHALSRRVTDNVYVKHG